MEHNHTHRNSRFRTSPKVNYTSCRVPTIRHYPRAHGDPDGRGFHDDDVLHRDDGRVRNDDHGSRDYDVRSFLLVLW
jgi:hypothetical protein